ncbi:MAG: ATP-binding protein [Planctomycetota bacterium]
MINQANSGKILIVESDAVLRGRMVELFTQAGMETIDVANHDDAMPNLDETSVSLLLTELPRAPLETSNSSEIDAARTAGALGWVRRIRSVAPSLPIVLTTSEEADPAACEALLQGAASYVPKKQADATLVETVEQVLQVSQNAKQATDVDECVAQMKLTLILPSHESMVPAIIAKLEAAVGPLNLFDEMIWTQVAMALDEAILNAMIHGNLEVDSELREQGDGQAYWDQIQLRRDQPAYGDRRTEVSLTATRSQAVFVIKDQGPGFDAATLPDPTDPANLESIGGRGLLLINAFMDEVHHNEQGNELTMIKRKAAGERPCEDDE